MGQAPDGGRMAINGNGNGTDVKSYCVQCPRLFSQHFGRDRPKLLKLFISMKVNDGSSLDN